VLFQSLLTFAMQCKLSVCM